MRGRHSAKTFSMKLGQLRLPPLLQLFPCLLSPNPSTFSLAFLSFFYQVLPSLPFFSQRNLLLSSSRVHTNATLRPKVCLPALQFLPSLSHNRFDGRVSINSSDGRVVWRVCLLSCRLGFDSESGQTNDFNIGIHSFPA